MVEHIERQTKQKDAIRAALADCEEFISAQDLHRRLEDEGSKIGLATVYRQLNALADAGAADTIRLDGQQLFRLCGDDGHHHHLVCKRCGKTVEIDPPSEAWLRKVADGHGFTVESHTLEVFGLCPDCQKGAESAEGSESSERITNGIGFKADPICYSAAIPLTSARRACCFFEVVFCTMPFTPSSFMSLALRDSTLEVSWFLSRTI